MPPGGTRHARPPHAADRIDEVRHLIPADHHLIPADHHPIPADHHPIPADHHLIPADHHLILAGRRADASALLAGSEP